MTATDFSTTFRVDQSPEEVFTAICAVRGWWSEEIEGGTTQAGDEFDYHYQDIHRCRIKITALEPGKKIGWSVLENYFKFTHDKTEWTGTSIIFDITRQGEQTEIRFTHRGLVPEYECFEICSSAWSQYIGQSLRNLISTGKGQPNGKDKPQTADEKKWSSQD